MQKPKTYNLTPARGQALLSFQGRLFPDAKMELFETELAEEIRSSNNQKQLKLEEQKDLHSDFKNLLIHGDALSTCAYLKSNDIKVDLVYIDPPFASGTNYAKEIYLRNGNQEGIENENTSIGEELMYGDIWQKEDYLNWLYERLLAIRDVMSENASIYVHIDWHIGHYAKILLDEVFGEENFRNEIIWHYIIGASSNYAFGRKHQTILFYSKGEENIFNREEIGIKYSEETIARAKRGEARYKVTAEELEERGKNPGDVWSNDIWDDINPIQGNALEARNYVTQKPEGLLERIIKASSDKGMIVADFFVGSGTTAKVAQVLGRKFIACDIGINAIQTTRDGLVKAGADFGILKIRDGVRLFRNPTQTTAKIFSLIDGYKPRSDLGLGEFWDGGIVDNKGEYVPIKFIQLHDRLTKELLDVILEEIYQLQDVAQAVSKVQIIYAHKDPDIDQSYVNKQVKEAQKTNISVILVGLDDLLQEKADKLFMPDNAVISKTATGKGYKVKIKKFYSPYLKTKIDEYNAKKVRTPTQKSLEDEEPEEKEVKKRKVTISDTGLELIEAVQFDTALRKNGIWTSNVDLEDKAGVKDKIKAEYGVPAKRFKMKIRNIAGDEIIIDSEKINQDP